LHHIIADGWSMEILYREISCGYEARLRGEYPALPKLVLQYSDYAAWERELLERAGQAHLEYWKKQLDGAPELLRLPIHKPRPSLRSHRGESEDFKLSRELTDKLKKLGRAHGCSTYMTLLTMFQILLARYSGSTDIVVGSPVANRNHGQLENLIGPFINTLAMRTDLSHDPCVIELLQRVREVTLEAHVHQSVPFEVLVKELRPERMLGYNPVVQVVMALHRTPWETLKVSGLGVESLPVPAETAKFDLLLMAWDHGETLYGKWEFSVDLFERASIQKMARHFEQLIKSAIENPAARISELELLSDEEKTLLAENTSVSELADTFAF
jgi:non-ribosomal peptide synthetase component F